ncbi:hypothetical protein BDW66DRAFT_77576 [Aspergillus desertorum]
MKSSLVITMISWVVAVASVHFCTLTSNATVPCRRTSSAVRMPSGAAKPPPPSIVPRFIVTETRFLVGRLSILLHMVYIELSEWLPMSRRQTNPSSHQRFLRIVVLSPCFAQALPVMRQLDAQYQRVDRFMCACLDSVEVFKSWASLRI